MSVINILQNNIYKKISQKKKMPDEMARTGYQFVGREWRVNCVAGRRFQKRGSDVMDYVC